MSDSIKPGRTAGIVIGLIFITGFTYFGYILLAKGEYIMLVPVIFGILLMLTMVTFTLLRPEKVKLSKAAIPYNIGLAETDISKIAKDDEFHLLLTSKDCVFITALASEFKKDGIDYAVFDQYAGRMMKFLPDMEMKVMVSGRDYNRCLSIVNDMQDGITELD